ncbi:MAG: hypothetical protein JRJ85_03195 [Deltaproteobacteria bacterium]|nr:hypothetical protein [Deltaproteobacteria bacterium]
MSRKNEISDSNFAILILETLIVIPAKAGIQINPAIHWIPAFAGMTAICGANRSDEITH